MESSVCWNFNISHRFQKSFVDLIYDLILNQETYGEVFRLILSRQWAHAIPSITFFMAIALSVWRHNCFNLSGLVKSINSKYFIPLQVLLIWMLLNISLTLWLYFQEAMYCIVWHSFSQNTKPWFETEHWWFSGEFQQFLRVFLWQSQCVSWLLAEIIAALIFYTLNVPLFRTKDNSEVQKKPGEPLVRSDMFEMGDAGKELIPPPEPYQPNRRRGRPRKPISPCPAEVCTKKN